MIFMIFIGADVMNARSALTQVPAQLAAVVGSWGLSPVAVVAADPAVLRGARRGDGRTVHDPADHPDLLPDDHGAGLRHVKEYTAIWFGIMVLMTVGFGLLAPPVGLNVYVVNGMARTSRSGRATAASCPSW
jgi:TRAP-type C4-dicarboxylate transport system permease large subunit